MKPTQRNAILWGTVGFAAVLLLAVLLLPALQPSRVQSDESSVGRGSVAPSAPAFQGDFPGEAAYDMGIPGKVGMPYPPPTPSAGPTAAEREQRLIKTGSVSVVVDEVREAVTRIGAVATGTGGFVQASSVQEREDGTHFGSVTVRVPVANFDGTMAEIRRLANLVEQENVTAQDVTEQYTDLQARLRNAKAQEASYLAILQRAVSVEDVLAVQRELFNVRAQIESLEGQLQYLENRTDFSTISVFLSEEPSLMIPTKEFRPLVAAREAIQALVAIAQDLALSVIWLVIVGGGILVPVALVAWIVVALVRRVLSRR